MVDNLACYRTKLLLKRESVRNNIPKIPMVYVKYNVPKAIRHLGMDEKTKSFTAPARLNKLNLISKTLRSAMEKKMSDRKNQIINVESHRLKGLGVGKCYSEYIPPPTAPEPVRAGNTPSGTPSVSNSRTGMRQSTLPSPMSNCQSATPTRHQIELERSMKSSQASAISQITKIYAAKQKNSNKEKAKDVLETKVFNSQTKRSQIYHPQYIHSPVLFSQSYHDNRGQGHHEDKVKGNHDNNENEEKKEENDENDGYTSYQNVKTRYHLNHGEYNK
ncbi:hypothetical protein ACF0H5_005453 [Mactra antiquata]